jgi:ABC-2 type transport system permease protein
MVAVSIKGILGPQHPVGLLVASSLAGAWFVGWGHANSAGQAGPAFVYEALTLTGRRELGAYFAGQNIALGAIGAPLLAAISFGLAAAAGHPGYGFMCLAVDLAGLGAALALSNIFSVLLPYPLEHRVGSPMPQAASGYRARVLLGVLGNLAGVGIAAIPVIVAIVLTTRDPAAVRVPLLVLRAAGYGLALAWAGVRIAAIAAQGQLPELGQIANLSRV